MRIAVLYVCTGKYDIFWEGFHASCEEMFFPEDIKDYYVFTDSKKIIELKDDHVHCYFQNRVGWPYDTLLRYNWICTVQDKLLKYDACFFMNANSRFLRVIDENVIPYPTNELPLIFWIHSHKYDDYTGATFHPERNPVSMACIPEGVECRAYGGGFWGGTSQAIVEMCCTLRDRVALDMNRGYIAVWHDQSHLEKYGTEHEVYNIPNGIIASEESADMSTVYMVFLDKHHFGGNDALRDEPVRTRIKHLPKKAYAAILKLTRNSRLDRVLMAVVGRIKKVKK